MSDTKHCPVCAQKDAILAMVREWANDPFHQGTEIVRLSDIMRILASTPKVLAVVEGAAESGLECSCGNYDMLCWLGDDFTMEDAIKEGFVPATVIIVENKKEKDEE